MKKEWIILYPPPADNVPVEEFLRKQDQQFELLNKRFNAEVAKMDTHLKRIFHATEKQFNADKNRKPFTFD